MKLSIHPIKEIQLSALKYHYIEAGKGETIFFLHGFPDFAGTWDESISELSKNYRCIAPFLRGVIFYIKKCQIILLKK